MPTPRRGATAATLLAAFLTILAALVAVPTTASAQGEPDPLFGAPTVGDCKNYGWGLADEYVETSEPVDCTTSHTAKVLALPLLPESLNWDDVTDRQVARIMLKTCKPALEEMLGGTEKLRALSAYAFFYFEPTNAQKANGARWIRCDVTLWGGERLQPLPADASPMLPAAPLPDGVARCLKSDGHMTVCSRGHAWRATGAKIVDLDAYPGNEKLFRIAKNNCPGLTTTEAWYATWPNRFYWNLGYRTIVCFSKTSN